METHTVAVLNSADDVIDAIREALRMAGFRVVTAHVSDIQDGTLDFVDFVAAHDPRVIVYDLPRPIERNWNFLRLMKSADVLKARCWVLTTIDKAAVQAVSPAAAARIIVGQPWTTDDVVAAVGECVAQGVAQ